MRWVCLACGHIYDEAVGSPEHGILPDTAFAELPDDWDCSFCGSDKQHFAPEEDL